MLDRIGMSAQELIKIQVFPNEEGMNDRAGFYKLCELGTRSFVKDVEDFLEWKRC